MGEGEDRQHKGPLEARQQADTLIELAGQMDNSQDLLQRSRDQPVHLLKRLRVCVRGEGLLWLAAMAAERLCAGLSPSSPPPRDKHPFDEVLFLYRYTLGRHVGAEALQTD